MRYLVIGFLTTTVSKVVEADTPEDAIDEADLRAPTFCHHCSEKVDVSDLIDDYRVVEDGGQGAVVHDDTDAPPTMAPRPADLDGILARTDTYGVPLRGVNANRAARDRAELVDWLRRSGVIAAGGR